MRLWTLHPRYLDAKGLVALWREALLAKHVLLGRTRGYRHHPQLHRFQGHPDPHAAIDFYLLAVHHEATARGYSFDAAKLDPHPPPLILDETSGQVEHEWQHLLAKLRVRSPDQLARVEAIVQPEPHPLFRLVPGGVRDWERVPPPG
jgi:hypothetical protein